MEGLAQRLTDRFPLLARLSVEGLERASGLEAIPPFFGIFLAAMATSGRAPLCFVLPRRGDAARVAAILYALNQFAAAERALLKAYGDATFKVGDLVRLYPSRHVYRFGGFDECSPEFICLRTPNGLQKERWMVRASVFLPRLERTTHTTPAGRLNIPIHEPAPAPLDLLLGTSTFGNQGLFRNELVLLDSATGFQDFLTTVGLRRSLLSHPCYSLKSLLALGEVQPPNPTDARWLQKWDWRSPTGEPLIALCHSAELAAEFCRESPARSRLVVVNGLSRMTDLQSFDDMAARQRLVLFADDSEGELLQVLSDRGCVLWEMTEAECELGSSAAPAFGGVCGSIRVWARNKHALQFEAESCEHEDLDAAAVHLESLREALRNDDPVLGRLAGRAWRLLNDAAAAIGPLNNDSCSKAMAGIAALRQDLKQDLAWLALDTAKTLSQIADDIERALPMAGRTKAAALQRVLAQSVEQGLACGLVLRESQVKELEAWLRPEPRWAKVQIHTSRTLRDEIALDRLICTSWPGTNAMQALAASLAAPRITLLGYAFERRWLAQLERRIRRHAAGVRITSQEKARLILGEAAGDLSWLPEPSGDADASALTPTPDDIWELEHRLRAARKGLGAAPTEASDVAPARYVSFVGDAYAFLIETHRVVVVTELLSARSTPKQRLPERLGSDRRPGDFIVFPQSGDRELIYEKADQLLGAPASTLRATARLWKDALQASRVSPEDFLKHARELGRPRHIVTIRKWFAETTQIGPGLGNEDLSEDLELIALVTDYEALKAQVPTVIAAIKELRSAHLSAGMRLRDVLIQRLPDVIGRVEEDGTMVDLGELGSAWVVQVESIAPAAEPRGRAEVNRLLREDRMLSLLF